MDIQENIINWLKELNGWQTELAYRILTKEIQDSDIVDIIAMIKSNSPFVDKTFPNIITSGNGNQIRLLSIESIQNIEGLAPHNPLIFEEGKNLTVIYGTNGSGKSGYTKIIKKISGKPRAKDLNPNVFNNSSTESKCLIKYKINGIDYSKEWFITDNSISDLSGIDVFDTNTGNGYVEQANSVAYTPLCITLFEKLSHYYLEIETILKAEKSKLVKKLPSIPNEYLGTIAEKKYNNLNNRDTESSLANILIFDESCQKRKLELKKCLEEKDPLKSAQDKKIQKAEINKIIKEIESAYLLINIEAINSLNALKKDYIDKQKISQQSAQIIAKESKFEDIGSNVWKTLWEAARAFSTQEVYKDSEYPNIEDNSRCVLCHQLLDNDAKSRLSSFEEFINGKIEKEAIIAKSKYEDRINNLPVCPNKDILSSKCNAANLDEKWLQGLLFIWGIIENVSNSLKQSKDISIDLEPITKCLSKLKEIATKYEEEAAKFEKDSKNFDREKAKKELTELNSRKWCSEQKSYILEEIERLKYIESYKNYISQCNTRNISLKVKSVSETILTKEYVERFNAELSALKANKIKVELAEKTTKGNVKHELKLVGVNNYKPSDILSEGEQRIIALASFLADVTGGNSCNPFVFDDPISSLDQTYEEKTVERLIELSSTRQVIVFTHRLSLLGLLNGKCNNNTIQNIGIKNECWGSGEIGNTPLFAKNPEKALKNIKNEQIVRAKKILTDKGSEEYYPYGKCMCSDIRITIERIVEYVLLADVVQRYRRSVNTLGKVNKLAKITKDDCDLIDKYMTKYSCYEHSQPSETPVEIPEPDEIEKDVDFILEWIGEFKKRA